FDCALYVMQPCVTLLLAISVLLTFVQGHIVGSDIFVISSVFSDIGWKVFLIAQFLITPLVLRLEKKVSKSFFVVIFLYSLNVFILPIVASYINQPYGFTLATVIYNVVFFVATFLLLGKKSVILLFRFLLYGLYTLTWIPITIQGILNKNNKEWSHTKHVRSVEICDL
ncbi:MAG: glycosyltransferase family 2 protein, partial [Clostridium chrysemydis]